VSLMAYEGLRPEEALALEDRHVRRSTLLLEQKNVDGDIIIGQKTGRRRSRTHRSPDLFDPVRRDLLEHTLALKRAPHVNLLFPRPLDGQPWRDHDWRNWRKRVFKPAVKAAGLPITRPYDLRHACASLLIQAGWPLTKVADHLGHSVATLSEFYAHLIADLRDAMPVPPTEQILAAREKRAQETG
jgi:integrase